MKPTDLIPLLRSEMFNESEDIPPHTYRRGWNDRARSLIRWLEERPVVEGLRELQQVTGNGLEHPSKEPAGCTAESGDDSLRSAVPTFCGGGRG